MEDIKKSEWFNVNLPSELFDGSSATTQDAEGFEPMDRELLMRIVEKARENPGGGSFGSNNYEAAPAAATTTTTTTKGDEENRQPAAADSNNRMSKAMSVDEYMEMDEDFDS